MNKIEIIFWISILVVAYTYVGYGVLLYILVRIKRLFSIENESSSLSIYQPEVTLLIAAYNEKDFVEQKVLNSQNINYPKDKLHQIWVTDGSDDGTPGLLEKYPNIKVLHKDERNGKIAAINRAMKYVNTPLVVFSDANTVLSKNSIKKIVELFADDKTGCVSGEKRIINNSKDRAAGAGEGIYWKYESALKKWDAELNTAVGAAGELFAVRTELFNEVEKDTLLDDFIISLRIAMKGYKIAYNPEAYAMESASANVKEELKRKIRIAAGGLQSIFRLLPLLNIFRYRLLSIQYISHRVLRWTLAPALLPIIFIANMLLMQTSQFYSVLAILQLFFYFLVMIGSIFQSKQLKLKFLFVPYYFFIMNYAVYQGIIRFLRNSQSVNWERAQRA
ncbi:MAG: glycosyltransferase family 2 protein [Bacteroidales bacterium]|nr:glycosyltransferase family 2 protein [Bacteroidales bacterium]